jgi:hypothetical protein
MSKHWLVPSRSQSDEWYEVILSMDQGWVCECIGFLYRSTCSHIQQVQELVQSKIEYAGEW